MKTKEIELSVGTVEMRALSPREAQEIKIESALMVQEIDEKNRNRPSELRRKLKVKALADLLYENLANTITNHNFKMNNGISLSKYLETLSMSDQAKLENASNELSNLTIDEAEDLPLQSEKDETPDSGVMKSSCGTTDCKKNSSSDGGLSREETNSQTENISNSKHYGRSKTHKHRHKR